MLVSLRTGFKVFTGFAFLTTLTYSVGCSNAFTTFAKKDDDPSLYYKVREYIREARYTDAIDTCTLFSDEYTGRADVVQLCAEAYAGRCNFKLLDRVDDLSTYDFSFPPAEKFFVYLMTKIADTVAQDVTDCTTAATMIRSIGSATQRTAAQNTLMLFLSLQTISTQLKVAGDADNDEVLDVTFDDVCTAPDLTDPQAQVVGEAFWNFQKSLAALSTNPFYTDLDTAVDTICSVLDLQAGGDGDPLTVGDNLGLCYATSPTALSAARLLNARSIIAEGSVVGIDQCGGQQDLTTCFCP